MTTLYIRDSVPLSLLNNTMNALNAVVDDRKESILLYLEHHAGLSELVNCVSEFADITVQYLCMNTIIIIDNDCIIKNFNPPLSHLCWIIYNINITDTKKYNHFKITEQKLFLELQERLFNMEDYKETFSTYTNNIKIEHSDNDYQYIKNYSVGVVP